MSMIEENKMEKYIEAATQLLPEDLKAIIDILRVQEPDLVSTLEQMEGSIWIGGWPFGAYSCCKENFDIFVYGTTEVSVYYAASAYCTYFLERRDERCDVRLEIGSTTIITGSDYDIYFFPGERYGDPTACCTHYGTSWINAAIWYQDGKWMSTCVADYYRQLVSVMRDDNKVECEHSTECE